jgi:hypothetical protein
MNKEFIPHEQSLELRKLEFSEPCLGFYVGKDKEVFMSSHDFNAPYQFRLDSKTTFVAPTFSQAFRWFRKKYNLYQDISTFAWNYDKKQLGFSIRTYLNPVNIETERKVYGEVYETYEEAELECVKKLIEIVKKK